mmetsp:Transcript_33672/g.85143  ORF Transcript_33672/g.85143 Transcript_33672/m.85143 type:complete len:339 (-) Transcript_33672:389-1405(-)
MAVARLLPLILLLALHLPPSSTLVPTSRSWSDVSSAPDISSKVVNLITQMNDLLLFPSSAIATNILNAALSSYSTTHPRYMFTMDVDQGGVASVLQVEAYNDGTTWHPLLTVPAKNLKASTPESFSTPIDVWNSLPVNDAFVVAASPSIDALLQSSEFTASVTGRPELVSVIHAERRNRDVGLELQFINYKLESHEGQMGSTTAALADKRTQLTTELAAKASALAFGDAVDSFTVVALSDRITELQAEIAVLEEKELLGPQLLNTLRDSVSLLTAEIATIQSETVSGSAVPDSRTYLFLVLQYQTTENFVAVPFRKQVVAYKAASGNWKLVSVEDFAL